MWNKHSSSIETVIFGYDLTGIVSEWRLLGVALPVVCLFSRVQLHHLATVLCLVTQRNHLENKLIE